LGKLAHELPWRVRQSIRGARIHDAACCPHGRRE
jgi:hypothetical protein